MSQRISVNISDNLRQCLIEACEKSGRTLTAEVEARLRDSLNARGSDCLLLLKFEEGLWAWLKAYTLGCSLWGSLEQTTIALIRSQIIKEHHSEMSVRAMFPYLPSSIQDAVAGWPALKGVSRERVKRPWEA
jgi:hypothetical protein